MTDTTQLNPEPQAIAPSNAGIEGAPDVALTAGQSAPSISSGETTQAEPPQSENILQTAEAALEADLQKAEVDAKTISYQSQQGASSVDPARPLLSKIVTILRRDFNMLTGELKGALDEADKIL